jgi:F-type H+-transporting ATPase subunit gamma
MATVEALKRRMQTTEDLQSVVKTMKAMAAVNIRQYEKAVVSLRDYSRTIELGLGAVLRQDPRITSRGAQGSGPLMAVVFGSDQGMAGSLNEQVVELAAGRLAREPGGRRFLLAAGQRAGALLEDAGEPVARYVEVPSSLQAVTPAVQEMLFILEDWQARHGIQRVELFYCRQVSGAAFEPHHQRMLPVDRAWLEELRSRPWPTRCLAQHRMERQRLFSGLVRQYLFVSLFRAFVESLASENASRLAAMQGAERNIEERLGELTAQFHRRRQMSITEELLDIVAGFEALKEDEQEAGESPEGAMAP